MLHFTVLMALLCSFYATLVANRYQAKVHPVLIEVAEGVPHIAVKDGEMQVDVPQPHEVKIEDQLVCIVDTNKPPEEYLEGKSELIVVGKKKVVIKESTGVVKSYPYQVDFDYDKAQAKDTLAKISGWVMPVSFGLAFLWQFVWKFIQVFLVAAFVSMITSTRVELGGIWPLAHLALGPAVMWGAFVFLGRCFGVAIPMAGWIFWGILIGLTYHNVSKLGEEPQYS